MPDIQLNLKIKVLERPAPLKIFFSYPDAPASKSVSLYTSHEVKEPSPHHNGGAYHNPASILLGGTTDAKSGKCTFEKQWLYMTLCS